MNNVNVRFDMSDAHVHAFEREIDRRVTLFQRRRAIAIVASRYAYQRNA